ncbi:MAG: hypothetical protein NTU73_10825 [Ignavibacteriae bacterium]|nr:hypothetical protein [Ignavibacteriota bacterium]
MRKVKLKKIISGGQTGADRAGLDAAKLLSIQTGGYCPNGFLTENGKDVSLKKFKLKELKTSKYEDRTIKNVLSSDGTVIFCKTENKSIIGEGTRLTYDITTNNRKPVIINPTKRKFLNWLIKYDIGILNVAGNRESQFPGIYNKTKNFLINALTDNE